MRLNMTTMVKIRAIRVKGLIFRALIEVAQCTAKQEGVIACCK